MNINEVSKESGVPVNPACRDLVTHRSLQHGWNEAFYSILFHAVKNYPRGRGVAWNKFQEEEPKAYSVLAKAHQRRYCNAIVYKWRKNGFLKTEVKVKKKYSRSNKTEEPQPLDNLNFCPCCGTSLRVFKAAAKLS